MIRAVLVDDERLARSELRRLLAAHDGVEIVGEAANAMEAKRLVDTLRPVLLFLDVQMPGGSGFDLLTSLDAAPEVIFTTAYDAYAIRAFEVNALDYLQKPIEPKRLAAAIDRAAARIGKRPAAVEGGDRIFIRDGERCWFVALPDIALFESEGNYTRVCFENNRPLILRSLNQLEEKLDPRRFFRASRRHIVNLDFVEKVAPSDGGRLTMRLRDGQQVELSRRRASELRDKMSL